MTVTVCWSAKGGSGTTVVAAVIAMRRPGSLLVDLAGDLPAVLGMPEPTGQGIAEWLRSEAPAAAIDELAVDVDAARRLVPRGGSATDPRHGRWAELAEWLATRGTPVVVDAGTGAPPIELVDVGRGWLVTRACYLAVRRAATMVCRPDGVVLVDEPGRALRARDIEAAVGAPVVASISIDPAVARAVDAGLLVARLPRTIARELRCAA